MSSRSRSLLAVTLCLALGASGCTKAPDGEGGDASAAAGEAAKPQGDAAPKGDATPQGDAKPEPKPPVVPASSPKTLAAAVEAMVETEVHYPAPLDPLLDLLPKGATELVVVRDLGGLLTMADGPVNATAPSFRAFATAIGSDATTDVDTVLSGYDALQAGLRGADFDLSRGLVIADVGDEAVVIYGASKPDALPALFRSLGATGDDMPDACAPVADAAGYVACAAEASTLAAYVPGKDAAGVRARLAPHVDAAELERANLVAVASQDDAPGKHLTFTLATPPGLAHFTMGLHGFPEDMSDLLGAGPSPALGLMGPGSGFYWAQLDATALMDNAKDQPFIVKNVLKTLTGEMVLGTLHGSSALVALAGVSDPAPAGGLVAMASLALDKIPKTLPDGSGLEVGVETLMIGGKDVQVLHATLTPKARDLEMFKSMGMVPEGWLFSAGGYAGLVFGGDEAAVETIASYGGGVMSAEAARALPKPLAQGLVDGKVSVAMHVPIDGLQSPQVAESFETVAKDLPADDLPPGMTPAQVMAMVRAIMAPVSGFSVWVDPPGDRLVFHTAIALMGDARTEQGKAELATMTEVAGGGDPAAAYAELAARFPSSPRAVAYQARAGTRTDGALASAAMLGMMAAIAIPAFVKYQARSREAGVAAREAARMAEAEAAAAAAEAEAAKAAAEAAAAEAAAKAAKAAK